MSSIAVKQKQLKEPNQINLIDYPSQNMFCPGQETTKLCHFIPLRLINNLSHNPFRIGGTQDAKINLILDSLVTNPKGQEEPVCLQWNPRTAEFEIVFGYNRVAAAHGAYIRQLGIANHPDCTKGIWAWLFTGTPAALSTLQLRENGNKKPQSPATKDQVARSCLDFIDKGGLGLGFSILSDAEKRKLVKAYLKKEVPFWSGRKFGGVWNAMSTSASKFSSTLSMKTWAKNELADYFVRENPYGIPAPVLQTKLNEGKAPSGTIVKHNGETIGIYFVSKSSEISGALPTSATLKLIKEECDKIYVIACLNNVRIGTLGDARIKFEEKAKYWNQNVLGVFTEVLWMPQTKKETDSYLLKGGWARITDLT